MKTRLLRTVESLLFCVSAVCLGIYGATARAADAVPAAISPEERSQLAERDAATQELFKLRAEDRLEEAIQAATRGVAIERRVLGDRRVSPIGILERWARYSAENGAIDAARSAINEVLAAKSGQPAAPRWEIDHLRRALADLEKIEKWSPEQRKTLRDCGRLAAETLLLRSAGDWKAARLKAEELHRLRSGLWARDHAEIGISLYSQGVIAGGLGELDTAEKLLTQGVELLERAVGARHPYCAMCYFELGRVAWGAQKLDEALTLLQKSAGVYEATEGPTSDGYLGSLDLQADLHSSRQAYAKAQKVIDQALPLFRSTYGEQSLQYANELYRAGWMLSQRSSIKEARDLVGQAVAIYRSLKAEDHPACLAAISHLGLLESVQGEFQRAEPLLREALDGCRRVYGERSAPVAAAMLQLANLLTLNGKTADAKDEGAKLAESTAELFEGLGPDGRLGHCQSLNLAGLRYASDPKTFDQAIKVHEKLVAAARETFGEASVEVAQPLGQLARILQIKQDLKGAEPRFKQALATYRAARQGETKEVASLLDNLGSLYVDSQQPERAERAFREGLDLSDKVSGAKSLESADIASQLGQLLVGREQLDEAEQLLRRSIPILRDAGKSRGGRLVFTLFELGQLLKRQKRHGDAITELKQAQALAEAEFEERSPVSISIAAALADCHTSIGFERLVAGDHPAAERSFDDALEDRRLAYGAQSADYAIGLSNLGQVLLAREQFDEAEKLLRRSIPILRDAGKSRRSGLAFTQFHLGQLLAKLKRYGEATAELKVAETLAKAEFEERSPLSLSIAYALVDCQTSIGFERIAAGDRPAAQRAFDDALEARRFAYGPESAEYAIGLSNLGALHAVKGEWKEARDSFLKSLAIKKTTLGEASIPYAWDLVQLASAQIHCGELDAAEASLTQARRFCETQAHSEPTMWLIMSSEASVSSARGDYRQAKARWAAAVLWEQKSASGNDTHLFLCLTMLATTNMTLNDYSDAGAAYREALDVCAKLHGKQGVEYSGILEQLGFVAFAAAKYPDADRYYREAYDILKRIEPENRLATASLLRGWSNVKRKLGRAAEAEADLQKAEALARQEGDRGALELSQCLCSRGSELGERGDRARAVDLLTQSVELARKAGGTKHEQYISSLAMLGLNYNALGDHSRALEVLRQAAELRKELSGADSLPYARALSNLATAHYSKGDYDDAEGECRQALAVFETRLGADSFECVRIRETLSSIHGAQGRTADALREFQAVAARYKALFGEDNEHYARVQRCLGMQYVDVADFAAAERTLLDALRIYRKLSGERSPDVADVLESLGSVYSARGDLEQTHSFLTRGLEIRRSTLHPDDLRLAEALDKFALKCQRIDFQSAESALIEARTIRERLVGREHREYATSLYNLGLLYSTRGQAARALPLLESALAIRNRVEGVSAGADVAQTLSILGSCCMQLGRANEAEAALLKAVALQRDLKGEHRAAYASSLQGLACLYAQFADWDSARSYLEQAVRVAREAYGEAHYLTAIMELTYAISLQQHGDHQAAAETAKRAAQWIGAAFGEQHLVNAMTLCVLGGALNAAGNLPEAEQAISRAVEISRKQAQGAYPVLTNTLLMAGTLRQKQGDLQQAEARYAEALELTAAAVGKDHPGYVLVLQQQASLRRAQGRLMEAEALYDEVLSSQRQITELAFDMLSERQQLAMKEAFAGQLNDYLALGDVAPVERAYRHVFVLKGAVFLRQMRLREAPQSGELAPLHVELQETVGRLCALAHSGRAFSNSDRENLTRWTRRKEELEKTLSQRSADFRKQQELERLTPEQFAQLLPEGAVLVDFVEYNAVENPANWNSPRERRLAAFVVRRGTPIARIELKTLSPVKDAIEGWRRTYAPEHAAELRRLVWTPLEKHLGGCNLVLLSLEGALQRFPWGALPGSRPGRYLIEEQPIVSLPAPQLAAEFLRSAAPISPKAKPEPRAGALVLVGDVDFGTEAPLGAAEDQKPPAEREPGRRSGRGLRGAARHFDALPGTKGEITEIERLWSSLANAQRPASLPAEVKPFSGAGATERAFRNVCPDSVVVHLATHGFFDVGLRNDAPDALGGLVSLTPLLSEFDTFGLNIVVSNPGISSGIALAGANRARDGSSPDQPDADDGLLTASEVEQLDLRRAELVVLSACETGLGVEASGEGVLGLQRAFHAAGAKRVIGSLWKIPDRATERLMGRFYANLWQKGMPPFAALREAQIWMLREGARQPDLARGLELPPEAVPLDDANGLHPYYWASFVLSGNWK
jgi:tetratricopeptide (TPR) repeat protein/CHAT domain-containing protein